MSGKKCASCAVKVGGLFGKKNAGTVARPLCNNCFEEEVAKEKAEKAQREKELREAEPQIRKSNEFNTKTRDKVMDIDGNIYTTVKIGNQVWTVENLKTTKYNDGTAIPLVYDSVIWSSSWYYQNEKPAYCWYDDNIDNKVKYGALYNWYAVNTGKLAPKIGWRVPTDADWTELEEYLIATGYNWDGSKKKIKYNKIAKALASKTDWNSDNDSGTIGNDLSKNNASGFSALPGGFRELDGHFSGQSRNGYWWSATEYGAYNGWGPCKRTLAYGCSLYCDGDHLGRDYHDSGSFKGCGLSVRLLRN